SSPSLVSPRPWMPSLSPYTTLFRSGRSKSQGLEALLELHHVDPGQGRRVQGERPLRPAARSRIRLGRDGLGPDGRAAEKGQQDGHHRPDPDPRPKTRHDWRSLLRAVVSPSRYAYGLGGPVMTGPDKPSYREDGPHIHGP